MEATTLLGGTFACAIDASSAAAASALPLLSGLRRRARSEAGAKSTRALAGGGGMDRVWLRGAVGRSRTGRER